MKITPKIILLYISIIGLIMPTQVIKSATLEKSDTLYFDTDTWITGIKDTIPSWVFLPCDSNEVIAFSDPGLSKKAATQQALSRTALLYQLSQGVAIESVFSVFNNQERKRYFALSKQLRMMTRAYYPQTTFHYQIVESHYSKFKEAYIKVRFSKKESNILTNDYDLKCFMQYKHSIHDTQKIICDIHSSSSLQLMKNYSAFFSGKKHLILKHSAFNTVDKRNRLKQCWYQDHSSPISLTENIYETRMNSSLWCAYLESIARSMLVHPYSDYKTRTTSQKYKTTQYSDLVRLVGQQKIQLNIQILGIHKNQLITQTQVTEVK